MAEDREKFDAALEKLGVARPRGRAANTFREARAIAREIGFPVLVRPSYVLGGRGMEIVYNEGQLASYVESAPPITPGAPLLVDKYMRGLEVEVDAVFDGDDIMIPGIFEHVERAGIHSGDSISVFPDADDRPATWKRASSRVTEAIARELGIRGLINIQFVIPEGTDELLIIEANPRASRTVPIISKATGHQSRRGGDAHRAGREAARHALGHRACARSPTTSWSKCRCSRSRRCAASRRSSGRR